jgi:hypothetical protein
VSTLDKWLTSFLFYLSRPDFSIVNVREIVAAR